MELIEWEASHQHMPMRMRLSHPYRVDPSSFRFLDCRTNSDALETCSESREYLFLDFSPLLPLPIPLGTRMDLFTKSQVKKKQGKKTGTYC
ncbi:unnamed protein product [Caenorhabditis nigoni]